MTSSPPSSLQNVAVMRHGDRLDAAEPLWVTSAERPWDPPLTEEGKIRAWATGRRLRTIGFPIHRVVVSPFLRCRQTAREVVAALCADVVDESRLLVMETSAEAEALLNPSKIKVHIEYGLCEVVSSLAMRIPVPAKDEIWFPDVSELETIFPEGTIDHSVESIYQKMPKWEEPLAAARSRYENVIIALADKFPNENILLVTHGEAVGVSISAFNPGQEVFGVEYCAYSLLQRTTISSADSGVTGEKFKVLTNTGVEIFVEEEQTPTNNAETN